MSNHEDKLKFYNELRNIMDCIVKEIIEPTCGISGVSYNPYLCDFDVWTMGDEEENESIRSQISQKYKLMEEDIIYIDQYTPLIQIAIYIYFNTPESA